MYIYIYIYTYEKIEIEHWGHNSNIEVFRPYSHLSGHAQTFPPGYRNLQ